MKRVSIERKTVLVSGGRVVKVMVVRQEIPARPAAEVSVIEVSEPCGSPTPIADEIVAMLRDEPIAFPKILMGAGL